MFLGFKRVVRIKFYSELIKYNQPQVDEPLDENKSHPVDVFVVIVHEVKLVTIFNLIFVDPP